MPKSIHHCLPSPTVQYLRCEEANKGESVPDESEKMESWKCELGFWLNIRRFAVLLPSCDRFPSLFDLLEYSLVRNSVGADFDRLLFEGDVVCDAFCFIFSQVSEEIKMLVYMALL